MVNENNGRSGPIGNNKIRLREGRPMISGNRYRPSFKRIFFGGKMEYDKIQEVIDLLQKLKAKFIIQTDQMKDTDQTKYVIIIERI